MYYHLEQLGMSISSLNKATEVFENSVPDGTLLAPQDVARRLQVSVAWVRDHSTRKHPRLPVVRVGGLLRYHPVDLERWIEDLRAAGIKRAS
jgi:hypothetical protein